jgi:general secretion pathway protein C
MVSSRPYRLALELGLLALVVCLAAFGVSAGLRLAFDEPPPPETDAGSAPTPAATVGPLEAYATIAARDIFNPSAPTGGTPGTPLALRLWGVGLFGGEARAVVEDLSSHRQDLYRVGDEIGDARVAAIDWDHVTLRRGGVEQTLELSTSPAAGAPVETSEPAEAPPATDSATIRRTGANAFVVDRRELTGAVDSMSGLLTQLRAVAEVEEGRPIGFRLFQIRDDSLFKRLGLENGDVVQRVNGATIGDPAALLGFIQRLRSEPRVALDIVRAGTPRTMVYDLR